MSDMDITVVIPTIPPRKLMVQNAIASVEDQRFSAREIIAVIDLEGVGAAVNRQNGVNQVKTTWTAFLDDDDYFYPQHLEVLMACALENDADYVYSWYDVIGGTDPRPEVFGVAFDPANPVQTTITTLVKTELAQGLGFLGDPDEDLSSPDRHYAGEDWRFTKRCVDAGAKIVHWPERTWAWRHHMGNTSGLPKNWMGR